MVNIYNKVQDAKQKAPFVSAPQAAKHKSEQHKRKTTDSPTRTQILTTRRIFFCFPGKTIESRMDCNGNLLVHNKVVWS